MKPATEESYALAEGPVWDAPRRRLLWVDILGGVVLEGALDDGKRRLNDGASDPAGRFLVGTLSLGGPSSRETLVRWDGGRITTLDDDLTLSNGLAWPADGRSMYSVDTLRRTVYVRDYHPDDGAVGGRRVHLRLTDGYPDGTTATAELTDEQLGAYPDSGRLFTVPVDVPGLPVTPWAATARS